MSFQAPISIADVVTRIDSRRLLLPAIQREFVWDPEQIERLFDSLLQGYPVGSFLLWEVRDPEDKQNYRYYEFLRDYRERYKIHNPEFSTKGHVDFDAVLDGQQRLTSIYIGLKGTYAYKKPRVWWEDSEHALPTRRFFLRISGPTSEEDDESKRVYDFKFLTAEEAGNQAAEWFEVGKILDLASAADLMKMFTTCGYHQNEFAMNALSLLHSVIHTDKVINYYIVKNADMDKALSVFIRVNSGGEPLSLSDILMSTAIANWKIRDARKEIFGLVDLVQAKGFLINKDLILKSCLYLYSADIKYKVSNFNAAQVKPFEDNWDAIQKSIVAVFNLVKDFGYTETSLTSKNALLPILYWVHHRGLANTVQSSVGLRGERAIIRRWLHTVLLKGVFGGATDTILTAIRRVFVGETFGSPFIKPAITGFPASEIATVLRVQGRDPQITDEFLHSLLYVEKEDKLAFALLALLRPDLDYKNIFHIDHLHPAASFQNRTKLRNLGVPSTDMDFFLDSQNWNSVLNLSLLDANENQSKNVSPLIEWVKTEATRQHCSITKFCKDHLLPINQDLLRITRFRDFVVERNKILSVKLREILS